MNQKTHPAHAMGRRRFLATSAMLAATAAAPA